MWPPAERQPLMPVQRSPIYARPAGICQFSGCTRPVMAQLAWKGQIYALCELHLSNAGSNLR